MGPDGYGGECLGCGNQENFINCADIAIGNKIVSPLPPLPGDTVAQQQPVPEPAPAAKAPAPAGPPYNTYNSGGKTGGGGSNNGPNGPNMTLVDQIVKKLAQTLISHHKQQSQTSWNQPTPAPQTPATQQPWKRPPPPSPTTQQQWQPPTTQQWQTPPTPQPNMWHTNDWMNSGSNHHVTEAPASSYPGYEPGEYPEPGEGPTSGSSSSGNSGQSSYMRGYNDAMRQLKNSFGAGNKNNAFNEISVHIQETQKNTFPQGYGGSMPSTCPDGSEFECVAKHSPPGTDFDSFCNNVCNSGQCPADMCSCSCPNGGSWSGASSGAGGNCVAVDKSKGSSMDQWCVSNCKQNNCPSDLCTCY